VLLLKSEYSLSLPAKTISTQQRSTKSARYPPPAERKDMKEIAEKIKVFESKKKLQKKQPPPCRIKIPQQQKHLHTKKQKSLFSLSLVVVGRE